MSNIPKITKEAAIAASASEQLLMKYIEGKLANALSALAQNAWDANEVGLRAQLRAVKRAFGLRQAIDALAGASPRAQAISLYLVSSKFLRQAYASLTQTKNEHLVYVTGPEDGSRNAFVLSRLVPFRLAHVSQGHAEPDPVSQMAALEQLSSDGQALLATFHSHPGHGADATLPSGTDLLTQDQLETLNYPTIGAIFSRDGFVRFYSRNREFEISVSGSGCQMVSRNVFRILDTRSSSASNGRQS
jgi:hypothetical protein